MRRPRPDDTDTFVLQEAFLDDVTGRRPRTDAQREAAFRRPPRGSVAARWHVYACGFFARVEDAMGLEYAAIRRILGTGAFADLIARYLDVFPPRLAQVAMHVDEPRRNNEAVAVYDLGAVGGLDAARSRDFTVGNKKIPDLVEALRRIHQRTTLQKDGLHSLSSRPRPLPPFAASASSGFPPASR